MSSIGPNEYTAVQIYNGVKSAAETHYKIFDAFVTAWLYGDWSEDKLMKYYFLKNVPFIGSYMEYKLDKREDEEYMVRYGMTYEDVHNPHKLKQFGSGSAFAGGVLNFVSSNIRRLY